MNSTDPIKLFCQKAVSKNFEQFTENNRNLFFFLSKVADLIFSYTTCLLLLSENFKDDGKLIKTMEILFQFLLFYSTDTGRSYYEDTNLISFVAFENVNVISLSYNLGFISPSPEILSFAIPTR